jgi:hypothetical protein
LRFLRRPPAVSFFVRSIPLHCSKCISQLRLCDSFVSFRRFVGCSEVAVMDGVAGDEGRIVFHWKCFSAGL